MERIVTFLPVEVLKKLQAIQKKTGTPVSTQIRFLVERGLRAK